MARRSRSCSRWRPGSAASAVAPILRDEWGPTASDLPLLTVAVQLGFAVGALALAARRRAGCRARPAAVRARARSSPPSRTSGFALVRDGPGSAPSPFRFLTGFALAAVYPVAMKLAAGWFRRERGLAIGVLIGALTLGSALPHLFRRGRCVRRRRLAPVVARGERRRPRGRVPRRSSAGGPGRSTSGRRGSRWRSRRARSASRRSGSRTSATSATCGSSTRCGRGCRSSSSRLRRGRRRRPGARGLAAFAVVASGGVGCVRRGARRGPARPDRRRRSRRWRSPASALLVGLALRRASRDGPRWRSSGA